MSSNNRGKIRSISNKANSFGVQFVVDILDSRWILFSKHRTDFVFPAILRQVNRRMTLEKNSLRRVSMYSA
jgi:hypothetical protein